jgi:hypothetical protein
MRHFVCRDDFCAPSTATKAAATKAAVLPRQRWRRMTLISDAGLPTTPLPESPATHMRAGRIDLNGAPPGCGVPFGGYKRFG